MVRSVCRSAKAWCGGENCATTSGIRAAVDESLAASRQTRSDHSAPLGSPPLPLVHTMATTSVGAAWGGEGRAEQGDERTSAKLPPDSPDMINTELEGLALTRHVRHIDGLAEIAAHAM